MPIVILEGENIRKCVFSREGNTDGGEFWSEHCWQIYRITDEVLKSCLHRIQRTPCACEGCEHWCVCWQGLHSLLVCTFAFAHYTGGEKSLSWHEDMQLKHDTEETLWSYICWRILQALGISGAFQANLTAISSEFLLALFFPLV